MWHEKNHADVLHNDYQFKGPIGFKIFIVDLVGPESSLFLRTKKNKQKKRTKQ